MRRVLPALLALLVAAASIVVFWRTGYPTITWWDSANYSLAAATFGVTSSPGSLLLTLLGRLATRLVPDGPATARALVLLAGAIASATAALVYVVARRLLRDDGARAAAGVALGALAFAFAGTVWEHAVMFTPYILTALFTALILLALVRWWDDAGLPQAPHAWRSLRWLALLGLLFGLDFSVHRSNALLIPGAAVWILMRSPRTLGRAGAWLAGAGGLALGLTLQLTIVPIARHTSSPMNMYEPTTWARFWDYVSLAQVGGGFLIDLWPRKAPLWSSQVADLARVLRDNWLPWSTPARALGLLPAAFAALGVATLWRRERRLGAAFVALLLVQAGMTVLYFNIPAGYFRSLDRHYLPVLVTVGVAAALGTGAAARRLPALGTAALALVPAAQLWGNWTAHDASRRWFARDYAWNALVTLPPRAILVTVGDNDTFPLWYLQAVEGVRRDVRVVNASLANAPWYVRQLARRTPPLPVSRVPDDGPVRPPPRPLDTTLVVGPLTLHPRPFSGTDWLPADAVLVDVVRTNAWRDPVCVSTTSPSGAGWLAPFARPEGLHWCVAPATGDAVDVALLRANLLARHLYRGYADPRVVVDDVAHNFGLLYLDALATLEEAEWKAGASARCADDARRMLALVPPERVGQTARDRAVIEARCRPRP